MIENGFTKKNGSYIDKLQTQLNEKEREIQQLKHLLIETKKQFKELEDENFELRANVIVLSNGSSDEAQLRKQLEEAQARIQELEKKRVYPSAIKKDIEGKPITNETIEQLFKSGMKPNQIGIQLSMTHQAIRKRLENLGLYGKKK